MELQTESQPYHTRENSAGKYKSPNSSSCLISLWSPAGHWRGTLLSDGLQDAPSYKYQEFHKGGSNRPICGVEGPYSETQEYFPGKFHFMARSSTNFKSINRKRKGKLTKKWWRPCHIYHVFTYIYSLLIEKGICDRQNISSFHVFVFMCTYIRRSL